MDKIKINNRLLVNAIWGSHACKFSPYVRHCNGYINCDLGDKGRIILEYLLSRIYSIHRLPGYEPMYNQGFTSISREYYNLTEDVIVSAEQELRHIINHVQNQLRSTTKKDSIKLVRSLRDFERKEVLPQILNGEKNIVMPSNIMTSYAYDLSLFGYGSDISVIRDVPIKSILFWDSCIEAPDYICDKEYHLGEYEVWVLNQDIYGEIVLPKNCFKILDIDKIKASGEYANSYVYNKITPVHEYDKFSEVYKTSLSKPCMENDILTRYIIKRNQNKEKSFWKNNIFNYKSLL